MGTFTSLDIVIYILNGFIAVIVLRAVMMIIRLSRNKFLGIATKPFSRPRVAGGRGVLFLGDSTAVGTGASDPKDSIAGRFATEHPDVGITNVAQNGGLVRDLKKQVAKVEGQQFDMVIISVGGNDVWHLTSLSKIQRVLHEVLPKVKQMSNQRVLFLLYNNIGSAPIFPGILRGFLKYRCERVQAVIRNVSEECGVPTIELFTKDRQNPFLYDPEELFAIDGIHPSSEGYRLWYNRMWLIMHENGFRF